MDIEGNKTGGRQKGTPNKTTIELREMVQTLFEERYQDFKTALDELDPKDKVDAYIKIMSFVLPKQKEIAMDVKDEKLEPVEIVQWGMKGLKYRTRPKQEDCTPEQLQEFYDIPMYGLEPI
jgi:hypothetical protein